VSTGHDTAPSVRSRTGPRRGRGGGRRRRAWDVLLVVSLGGGLGAAGRHAVDLALPHGPTSFPWSTYTANVVGCLLIGVLMVLVVDVWAAPRLVRPFLGVGVLGGFTTFSTYAVETRQLVDAGAPRMAFGYLAATLLSALLAVQLGVVAARVATRVGRAARPTRSHSHTGGGPR